MKCKTCDGEMIQKNRWRISIVGVLMVVSVALAAVLPLLLAPGVLLLLAGSYLIIWGTVGKGRWCRVCKKFGTS